MDFSCHICSGGIDDFQKSHINGFYRYIECDVNFHLSCILPDTVKHKYHWHPLYLMNSTKEDNSDDQYYCDICETKRNPDHFVYACKECDYCVAHIECALGQERKNELKLSTKGPSVVLRYMEVRPDSSTTTTAVKKWTNGANVEMRHPFHDHFLCLDTPRPYQMCRGSGKYFAGIAFMCKSCGDFDLHERCAEFPLELLNFPLHSHHPPLILKSHEYSESSPSFSCNVCGKVRDEFCFRYQCTQCNFFVDTKCAFLSTPTLSHQQKNIVAKHFSHQHLLHLVPCGAKEAARCWYCGSKVEGLGYRCMETTCWFYLHEPCIRQIPRQLKQLHFHPSHPLVLSRNRKLRCNLCGLRLKCLGYDCSECGADISVHSACALFQRRTLKSSHHDHVLYYFGRDINLLIKHLLDFDYYYSDDKVWFKCERCGGSCSRAFYRCLECDINFHLECIPIPPVVKSKCHRHPVNLVDSFVVEGYDLDAQYCDVCEEKRDSRDHAYYCKRCSDPFVGHVDSVLYKMEQIIEEAKQGPSIPCCNHLDSTDDEKVFGNQRFVVKVEISINSERVEDYETQFVDFHPTKPWLVTSDKYNFVNIWSYETEELQMEKSFKAKYSTSKFIERENWIVIGDRSGYIYIFDYETSKKIHKFKAHDSWVKCLAVHSSRSYSYLLSSGDEFVIRLWDWKKKGTWLCIKEFVDHYPTPNRGYDSHVQVAFNPKDLNTFASIANDDNLMIWDINSSYLVCVTRVVHLKDENERKDLTYIKSIEFFMHCDKQYLLGSFKSGLIKVWEYTSTAQITCVREIQRGISISVSCPDNDRMVVGICIDATNYRCTLEKVPCLAFGDFTSFTWGERLKRMVLIWGKVMLMVKITSRDDRVVRRFRRRTVR